MLEAKYKIGQKVYAVSKTYDIRNVHVNCNVCNSTGKVKINGRKISYECPVCHGATKTEYYGHRYVISYFNATIGKVKIEEYAKKYDKEKSEVTYMLDESGVCSGVVWKEDRLFLTEKEANNFCERYIPFDYYSDEAILKEEYKNS